MFQPIARLFAPTAKPAARTRLGLEALDRRDLPSITWVPDGTGLVVIAGHVQVTGDGTNDEVVVTDRLNALSDPYDDQVTVTRNYGGAGADGVGTLFESKTFDRYLNTGTPGTVTNGSYHLARINGLAATLGDGQNRFTNKTNVPSQVTGGKDEDVVRCGSGADTCYGMGGSDTLYGNDGWDTLYGGPGNDLLVGGQGTDCLYGDAGDDTLVTLDGGIDFPSGGGGNDLDTFWADHLILDNTTDASAAEIAGRRVHRVAGFSDLAQMKAVQIGGVTSYFVGFTPVGTTPNGPDLLDPVSGGAYKGNFRDHPLFGRDGPRIDDVDQNAVPDCWMLSALAGIAAKNPDAIRQAVTDLGDGTYAVRFYRAGQEAYYRVDADLATTSASSTGLRNAGFGQDGSIWVSVIEKAYAFYRRDAGTHTPVAAENGFQWQVGWYDSVGYGDSADAGRALGLTSEKVQTDSFFCEPLYRLSLMARIDSGHAVTLSGPSKASEWSASLPQRSGAHAWTVVGYTYDYFGNRTGLRLRNPYREPGAGIDPYQTVSFEAAYASSVSFADIQV